MQKQTNANLCNNDLDLTSTTNELDQNLSNNDLDRLGRDIVNQTNTTASTTSFSTSSTTSTSSLGWGRATTPSNSAAITIGSYSSVDSVVTRMSQKSFQKIINIPFWSTPEYIGEYSSSHGPYSHTTTTSSGVGKAYSCCCCCCCCLYGSYCECSGSFVWYILPVSTPTWLDSFVHRVYLKKTKHSFLQATIQWVGRFGGLWNTNRRLVWHRRALVEAVVADCWHDCHEESGRCHCEVVCARLVVRRPFSVCSWLTRTRRRWWWWKKKRKW